MNHIVSLEVVLIIYKELISQEKINYSSKFD